MAAEPLFGKYQRFYPGSSGCSGQVLMLQTFKPLGIFQGLLVCQGVPVGVDDRSDEFTLRADNREWQTEFIAVGVQFAVDQQIVLETWIDDFSEEDLVLAFSSPNTPAVDQGLDVRNRATSTTPHASHDDDLVLGMVAHQMECFSTC